MMKQRWLRAAGVICFAVILAGCPKGNADFKLGKKAESVQDLDTALVHYERALRADPANAEYRLKATRTRFEAAAAHVSKGVKFRENNELALAIAEFEKAAAIDPSSAVAKQELRRTLEMTGVKPAPPPTGVPQAEAPPPLLEGPPQLKPLSREPINLRLTNDARIVYETLAKIAGITVIFDADFQQAPRRISTDLSGVTIEQALDVVALQSKTFWKPVAPNVIFVIPDQPQKRKDNEEMIVKTIYLSNTVQPQDLTEIMNSLRQLFELRRILPINSQNAIVMRDSPDKIALIEKVIRDVDKARPEVVVSVAVLQARRDRLRDLGIQPGSSSVLSFTPQNPTGTGTGTTSTGNQVRLSDLQRLSSADYSLTLPGATATALITDSSTRIIQNPEIRAVDGQSAKLRVGDRVPVATGSFQAGVGVGGTTATGVINPLVNTQFQYIEVGVNVDITPRVHLNRDVSLKISVEVSSVSGRTNIGGIEQPIISQRKIDHDVRLREGEVNVLGGLIEQGVTKSVSGWPGLSRIPFLRYFFSSESYDTSENEVLIVLTPRILRLAELTAENLRSASAGTDSIVQVRREEPPPASPPPEPARPVTPPRPPAAQPQPAPAAPGEPRAPSGEAQKVARLKFDPAQLSLQVGQTTTVGIAVSDVQDLFSIPLLIQYNPAVISVEEVRHADGGFLSGGTQEVAIVQRIDKERGQVVISATRQPNTPGVSGSGTLAGIVVRAVAPGSSALQILQVLARDSKGRPLTMVSSEGSVKVQ
jgi:general secretion pathway protein D